MTISFFEPGAIPKPPDEVKIEHLAAEVYPDRQRVKITIHVTPFQQRPSLEVHLRRKDMPAHAPVATLSIVETMHHKMDFTLHIRGVADTTGDYLLQAMLYFRAVVDQEANELPPVTPQDTCEIELSIVAEGS